MVNTRKQFSFILNLALVLLILGSSGCLLVVGAGAGAGGAVYVMGKLEEEIKASPEKLEEATVAALKDLEMPVTKDQGDKLSATIESKTADDKDVWIHIESLTTSKSKISIRVGYLGDEVRSHQILEAIRQHL